VLLEVRAIVYGVIDAAFFALEGRQDSIKAAVVTISRREESLRCPCVPPAAERSDEGGQVAVRLAQGYAVIAVPGIRDCLPRVFGDTTCKMEGCLGSECLSFIELVQWGEIYCATRGAIMLPCDHHSVAPCHRFTIWYAFNDTKSLVSQEVFIHTLLPM